MTARHRCGRHVFFATIARRWRPGLALLVLFASNQFVAHAGEFAPQPFEIAAGLAERTLAQFARQSEQPTIFPSDPIRGVKTSAVSGDYPPIEALKLMLAGTALAPSVDEQSGTLVIKVRALSGAGKGQTGMARGEVVLLPPYEVDVERGRPWHHANHKGVEVLFRCPESIAVAAMDRYFRLNRMLAMIVPAQLQPLRDLPTGLILEDAEYEPSVAKELKRTIFADIAEDDSARQAAFLPSFHFWDDDSGVFYFVLQSHPGDRHTMTITPAYVRYLLETRSPRLPRWFIEGMMKLLETIVIPVPGVDQLSRWDSSDLSQSPYPYDKITVRPFVWGGVEQTEELQRAVRSEAKRTSRAILPDRFPLVPMGKLLRGLSPAEEAGNEGALAAVQAALFLRWIFDPQPETPAANQLLRPGPKPTADALWKFLARCESEAPSEELFEECFGWTYAEMETLLRSYLPYASLKRRSAEFVITSEEPIEKLTRLENQPATVVQIARLRGRLHRLGIRYVRQFYPELVPAYITQARRTLKRGMDSAGTDKELVAESGLCEVDAGSDSAALPLLLAAAEAGVVHPRVYYELARIQFARVRAVDAELAVSAREVDQIADRLLEGLKQQPALPQAYELLFEIWLRRKAKPTPADVWALDEGGRLFAERFRVAYAAVLLQAAQGNPGAARALGLRSLPRLAEPEEHERMEQLLKSLKIPQT